MSEKKSFEELKQMYANSLHGQVLDVEQYWLQYKAQPSDLHSLENLLDACHKIAGTGTSFGFPVCSESAREIENTLRKIQEDNQALSTAARVTIGKHLNQLRKAATTRSKK